jgi:hypothetical protein
MGKKVDVQKVLFSGKASGGKSYPFINELYPQLQAFSSARLF